MYTRAPLNSMSGPTCCGETVGATHHPNPGAVLISGVAPGFSPAHAALKGGATFKLGQYQIPAAIAFKQGQACAAGPFWKLPIRNSGQENFGMRGVTSKEISGLVARKWWQIATTSREFLHLMFALP